MKCFDRVRCAHPDCRESVRYEYDSRRDMRQAQERRGAWLCVRHDNPEKLLSASNRQRTASLVSSRGAAGLLYWNGSSGFAYGPGFKAFADDFPEGTRIEITTTLVLPDATREAAEASRDAPTGDPQ